MADETKKTKKFLDLEGLKYFWEQKVKKFNETLNKQIEVTVPVGNLGAGTLESGKTIVEVLESMLCKTFYATKTAKPTCTLDTVITGTTSSFEVGTTVELSLASTYKDGTIQNYTGKTESAYEMHAAGCKADTPVYKQGSTIVATGDKYKIGSGNNTFTVSYAYSASTFDGVHSDLSTKAGLSIASGTCSATKTLTGYYKMWYGALDELPDATAFTRTTLTESKNGYANLTGVLFNKANYAILIIKSTNTDTIKIKDTSTNADLEGGAIRTEVSIKDAGDASVSYYLYTYTMADPNGLGNNKINISFS